MTWRRPAGALVLAGLVVSCSSSAARPQPSGLTSTATPSAAAVPHFAHIVVVLEENRGFTQIVGAPDALYLNSLIKSGTLLTHSYAVTHPSEPNYLALFSGSTHNLTSDECPVSYSGPDLASALAKRGRTFVGYAEGLPSSGSQVCRAGGYVRKHAPWVGFGDVPASASQPMTAFPTDFAQLPSVAFVVPNLDNDMHDGSIGRADTWLRSHLDAYAQWARTHDSLLVVTFDEDDRYEENRVPTILVGAHVKRGAVVVEQVDHYSVLRTIEDAFGTDALGRSAQRHAISGAWSAT